MYPHERSFVKKFQGKPVVLLGVNSDGNREALKKVLEKEKITWRSWWDGGGTKGPVASKWQVHGWPTIYIIDAKGIIRVKDDRGEIADKPALLERAVTALLRGTSPEIASNQNATKADKKVSDAQLTRKKSAEARDANAESAEKKIVGDKEKTEQTAGTKFTFAEMLANGGKTEKAKERCREILRTYPATRAAADAQELLDKLDK